MDYMNTPLNGSENTTINSVTEINIFLILVDSCDINICNHGNIWCNL